MSIIRSARPSQFYILPTTTINDERLSWEARGLLIYLLSKQDYWKVQIKDLINQTKGAIGRPAGRDKVYTILKELRIAGYIVRSFNREGGEFVGVEYEVSETPDLDAGAAFQQSLDDKTAEPFTAETDTAKPPAAPPFTAKPETLDKTERATRIEKAVNPIADPQPENSGPDLEQQADATLPPDYPSEFPQNPASSIFAAWLAYAVAFRERYKIWPVYNATVAGVMGKAVARIQGATPAAATHYVKQEDSLAIVDKLHPITIFLKNCEAYAGKAVLTQESKKRADKAAAAVLEAENASSAAPSRTQTIKPSPSASSAGNAALNVLKGIRASQSK